ncbi:MAG: TSUP family transporter [Actinobacteria bacterium]|nr:TSUP family transporter [Actinomycetota bacterium]
MSIWIVLFCVAAAFLAGFVDAVAGGGGLIQLPVLLWTFPTAPLASILGTNKAVSIVGTSMAANTYRKKIEVNAKQLIPTMSAAFVGSLCGALLATNISRDIFEPIILIILIAVGTFTVLRPDFGKLETIRKVSPVVAPLIGLVIGFYDGLIGPGTGMFLLFSLVSFVGTSFLGASAIAKFVNVATNLAALIIFIPGGHVIWLVAALMAPANLIGGYLGARTALDRGSSFVRYTFLLVLAALVIRLVITI